MILVYCFVCVELERKSVSVLDNTCNKARDCQDLESLYCLALQLNTEILKFREIVGL